MTKTVTVNAGPCDCCGDHPCTTCTIVVFVYNSNAVCDDDFELFLNGTVIANLPETDLRCEATDFRGSLVYPPSASSSLTAIKDAITAYISPGFPPIYHTYSASELEDLASCFNELRLHSTSNNECSNFGQFYVFRVCDTFTPLVTDTYSSVDFNPVDHTYSFANPCCDMPTCCDFIMPLHLSLYIFYHVGTDECGCNFDLPVALTYNDGLNAWVGSATSDFCDVPTNFSLACGVTCSGNCPTTFSLTISGDGFGDTFTSSSATCDPLAIAFDNMCLSGSVYCGGAAVCWDAGVLPA